MEHLPKFILMMHIIQIKQINMLHFKYTTYTSDGIDCFSWQLLWEIEIVFNFFLLYVYLIITV